ncbi:hypothetical protein, partial [Streptococcus pseudopneumoniae]|uniref:hypothetical protein n=1 Tax=Streptococcus pseudopneumoniae TaxID=257758 RepID=UPI0019D5985C
ERIDSLRGDNKLKSAAIGDARRLLAVTPVIAVVIAALTFALLGDACPSSFGQSRAADSEAAD